MNRRRLFPRLFTSLSSLESIGDAILRCAARPTPVIHAGRRGAAACYAMGNPDSYRPIGEIFAVFRGAIIQSMSCRARDFAARVAHRPKTPARNTG